MEKYTVAGTGTAHKTDGPLWAGFNGPYICIDLDDSVIIADAENHSKYAMILIKTTNAFNSGPSNSP